MAKIRNKKIAKVRLDNTNFDAVTTNRALDNIIDNLNPFINEVVTVVNAGDFGISAVTIEPSGAVAVVSDNFILSGSGGITFGSDPLTNTIVISQSAAPSSSITFNVQGASQLTGSTFNVSGAGGISFTTPNSNTLIINSPTVQINTETGSVAGSNFNLFGGSCAIDTFVSGGNIYISSSAKPVTGGTNITVSPDTTQVVANPTTTFLFHADNTNGASGSVNDGFAANCVGFEQAPLISGQPTRAFISTAFSKFGVSSFFFDGDTTGYIPPTALKATGSQVISGSGVIGLRPDLTGFSGSSGNFTLEGWFYPDFAADPIATLRSLFHINQSNAQNFGLSVAASKANISNQLSLSITDGIGFASLGTTPVGSFLNAAWNHVAITRSGSLMTVYINGVNYLQGASPNIFSADQIQVGGYAATNAFTWKGYIDEIRISNGTVVYNSNFTPPTAAFGNYFTSSGNACLDQVSLNNNISLTSITASGGFSGNLFGTASFATNALSASFATTSSFATNALSSSFATNALSSSFATTSSFATNALSSSFATTALTASLANTASFALDAAVGGDLSGSSLNATVIRLQGRNVSNAAPLDGESLVWSSIANEWQPFFITGSGGGLVNLPTFHQTGSASGTVEIQLPNGATQFPVADLDYIAYTVTFQETSGSNWNNDLGSVELKISASHVYAVIDADAYAYNFNAVNSNISSSTQFSPPRYYGSFCDTTTQTASSTTVAYPMYFNTDEGSSGFSIVSGSQITAQYAGTYNLQFSTQVNKGTGGPADIKIWFRKNGVNIPRSATKLHIQGNNAAAVAAWNFITPLLASEYLEIMWNTDDTAVELLFENSSSSPDIPQIPSVIATIQGV